MAAQDLDSALQLNGNYWRNVAVRAKSGNGVTSDIGRSSGLRQYRSYRLHVRTAWKTQVIGVACKTWSLFTRIIFCFYSCCQP